MIFDIIVASMVIGIFVNISYELIKNGKSIFKLPGKKEDSDPKNLEKFYKLYYK